MNEGAITESASDSEYLRKILGAVVRNDDSEVRPEDGR
jgi:hypothetical protein